MLLLNGSLVWNYNQIALIVPVCGTGRLQDDLAIVVGVSQFIHDLTVLAVVIASTVSLPTLGDRLRIHILVHQT